MRDVSEYRGYLVFARRDEWFIQEVKGKGKCYGPYPSERFAKLKVDERTWPTCEVYL